MTKTSRKTLRSSEHKALCQILIDARKQAGLTQAQIADTLQLPQSDISKIETGERRLDVIEFINLCRAMHTDPLDVIKELD